MLPFRKEKDDEPATFTYYGNGLSSVNGYYSRLAANTIMGSNPLLHRQPKPAIEKLETADERLASIQDVLRNGYTARSVEAKAVPVPEEPDWANRQSPIQLYAIPSKKHGKITGVMGIF
jgi:hypothetical protein